MKDSNIRMRRLATSDVPAAGEQPAPSAPGDQRPHVVVVGAGFAGLEAAKALGRQGRLRVTVVDRRNHHLFQPLLYQVAMAGLNPSDIAVPIRRILARHKNSRVLQAEVVDVDRRRRRVRLRDGELDYDYLILATGARHDYFGHREWEPYAPGLKTIEQAIEIRRRVLGAFERAERESEEARQRPLLTFVIVGAGPTGVELAGAIAEMSRYTLARDFRRIDPQQARVILLEAGPRILPMFSEALAHRARRDLMQLGARVWTRACAEEIGAWGVRINGHRIEAGTVLWAAGVEPSRLGRCLGADTDGTGRVRVAGDLSLPEDPRVFVLGDLALALGPDGEPLPGLAAVAHQQGRHVARAIAADLRGRPRPLFRYRDYGQMATIGRSRAIAELGGLRFGGFLAWLLWLFVHILYLTGFRNRVLVAIQWAAQYIAFGRGARLITEHDWRFYAEDDGRLAD